MSGLPRQPTIRDCFASHDGLIADRIFYCCQSREHESPHVFVMAASGWSTPDYRALQMLCEHTENLVDKDAIVRIIDADEERQEIEAVFVPHCVRGPGNPFVGYWERNELRWVESGFPGVARMFSLLKIPVDELKRRLVVKPIHELHLWNWKWRK